MGNTIAVAFSPSGNTLAAAGYSPPAIRIWNIVTGELLQELPESNEIDAFAYSPTSEVIAVAIEGGDINLWDVVSGKLTRTIATNSGHILALAFSSDGQQLVSSHLNGAGQVWAIATGQRLQTIPWQTNAFQMAWNVDETKLAVTGEVNQIDIWDSSAGKRLQTLSWEPLIPGFPSVVRALAFSPEGRILASGHGDGRGIPSIKLWDMATGTEIATLTDASDHQQLPLETLAFSPDGVFLIAAGDDATLRLWEMKSKTYAGSLHGHTLGITDVTFGPDGRYLASASTDGTIVLWRR